MEEFTGADGSRQTNHYDAEGLRHEMEENGKLVQFLYSGREVAAETEADGNIIRYIRGLGLVSSDSEKAKTYYHYVTDEYSSVTHVIEGEEKSGDCAAAELATMARDKKQSSILWTNIKHRDINKSADALELANREIIFGTEAAKSYGEQNMTKSYT